MAIPDAQKKAFALRYPFDRGNFNTSGYTTAQELLGDIEAIYVNVLEKDLGIRREDLSVGPSNHAASGRCLQVSMTILQSFSVILLIPDIYDYVYVREMTDLLVKTMGFKQICVQQVRRERCCCFGNRFL